MGFYSSKLQNLYPKAFLGFTTGIDRSEIVSLLTNQGTKEQAAFLEGMQVYKYLWPSPSGAKLILWPGNQQNINSPIKKLSYQGGKGNISTRERSWEHQKYSWGDNAHLWFHLALKSFWLWWIINIPRGGGQRHMVFCGSCRTNQVNFSHSSWKRMTSSCKNKKSTKGMAAEVNGKWGS